MSRCPSEPDVRIAAARDLLVVLARRVAIDEAVGVLRCWWGCSDVQARGELHARYGPGAGGGIGGIDAEAARVVAVSNADADGRADPEFGV